MSIDDDATQRTTDSSQMTTFGIYGIDNYSGHVPAPDIPLNLAFTASKTDCATVAAQKAVSNGVAVWCGVSDGEKAVVVTTGAGNVSRLTRAMFWARAPGAIAHAEAIDVYFFAVQNEGAGNPAKLVKVMGGAKCGTNRGQRLWRHNAGKAQ